MEHYKALFKSFFYAFRGIVSTVRTERNMRIHLTCMIYMFSILIFSDWFVLSKGDWCAIVLACALVVCGELINTAIENVVDMVTDEYNEFAKKAKDAASGAVLVGAVGAVAVGLVVLLQPQAFKAMYHYFVQNPLMFLLFVLSLIPATLFIFLPFSSKEKKKKNQKN
ncbi:MAG: diacylglycerol kinase family protein [Acutalibacteraceae bacterium]